MIVTSDPLQPLLLLLLQQPVMTLLLLLARMRMKQQKVAELVVQQVTGITDTIGDVDLDQHEMRPTPPQPMNLMNSLCGWKNRLRQQIVIPESKDGGSEEESKRPTSILLRLLVVLGVPEVSQWRRNMWWY